MAAAVENRANHGLPSLHSGYWDAFLAACEETGTVVCLHVGSAQWSPIVAHDAPLLEMGSTMFPVSSLVATAEWFWSGVPVRFPQLKIAMSEGGIGWVPMLLDRLDHVVTHSLSNSEVWRGSDLLPSEVIRRNFWFCTIDDPSTMELRHVIGVENIMLESDYPHSDSTWPDTQQIVHERIGHLPADEIRRITHANAAELFGHPVPDGHPRSMA